MEGSLGARTWRVGDEPLRVNVIKRIIISSPNREELRKLPGLAINNPDWPGDPLE